METAPIPHGPEAAATASHPLEAGVFAGAGASGAAFSFAGMGLMGVRLMGAGLTGAAGAGLPGAGLAGPGFAGTGSALPALQVRQSLQTDLGGTPLL